MTNRSSMALHVLATTALFAWAALAAPLWAAPANAGAGGGDAPSATPSTDVGAGIELEAPRDGYSYNPQGRRDPFVCLSCTKPRTGPAHAGERPQGIAGLMIQEVALKGIVKDAVQGYIALLLGPDGRTTYFSKVGQRLYDGAITAIDAATVKFRQEVTDPLSPVKTREVMKTLYPSEEARQ